MGALGRFWPADGVSYRRGTQVICRTARGLELGDVLATTESKDLPQAGSLLRKASVEDLLLWARIEKHRASAFAECQRILDHQKVAARLMDVELLFDGKSLFFYFLGSIPAELEPMLTELAAAYEAKVQLKHFAEAMTLGCGPDCGTELADGCSDGGCSGCSISNACSNKT